MKRMIFLMLTLLIGVSASMNAQVRIGGTTDPNPSAILDLNATDGTNNGTLGLSLPRVELTSTSDAAPLAGHVRGMLVYNTATAGNGDKAVTPGIYFNTGTAWIKIDSGSLSTVTTTPGTGTTVSGAGTVASPLKVDIATGGVTNTHLAEGTIDSTRIKNVSVGQEDLAVNSVNTSKILDGTILPADLADGAVITAKIADKNVTAAKLADDVLSSTAAPIITTQPKSFSWSRLKEANGDPNGPATVTTIADLTITASGTGLTYQWYKKATNKNAADTPVAATRTYTPAVNAWGMNSYYCVVSNDYGSVTSNIADVAIGCGAKTATGGWLKFMCYNLGGKKGADPFVFNVNDSTNLGKFYQWGRPDSIARTPAVPANFIAATAYPYDWKMTTGYGATPPLSASYHQDDYLWRNHRNGDTDPCPTGWHVPSQSAFGAIFKGTADADVYGNATANTWDPSGRTWAWTSASNYGNGGYAVKPDGVTTTLFFPAAGYRLSSTGALGNVGLNGTYWSSTPGATGAFNLAINSGRVYPANINTRGHGFSVRCVSE